MSRILFLGQKPVGDRCFELLVERGSGIEVCGAVSNPDASVWWGSARVFELAREHGIPFVSNAERAEAEIATLIDEQGADTLISVQHSWVISPALLENMGMHAFNLHNAPLPDYKGYNAANHAILNGETTFAATVHWMAAEVDAGDVAFEERFEVAPDATAIEVHTLAAEAGLRAFARLVDSLTSGEEPPRRPISGDGTFYPRDSLDDQREIVNPSDAEEVDRKARAFHFPPFESAYYVEEGEKKYVEPPIRS